MPDRVIRTGPNGYGPIGPDFELPLSNIRYTAIAGRNNSGKSALLQLAFFNHMTQKNPYDVCFVPQDRQYIPPTTIPNARLHDINQQILGTCNNAPRHSITSNVDLSRLYVALL